MLQVLVRGVNSSSSKALAAVRGAGEGCLVSPWRQHRALGMDTGGKFPLTHTALNPRDEKIPWAGRKRIPEGLDVRSCRGWGSPRCPQELPGHPCTSQAHPQRVIPAWRPGFVGFQSPAWKKSSGMGPTSCLPGVSGFCPHGLKFRLCWGH